MHIVAIVALAAGLILGILFRPIAIVGFAAVAVALSMLLGSDTGTRVLGIIVAVTGLNIGYLLGVLAAHRGCRRRTG